MVSSVSSDRSLTAQSERLLCKQVFDNTVPSHRRKQRDRNWIEFVKTAKSEGASDAKLSSDVKQWFLSLEPRQRQECLCYEHRWLCSALQRMLLRKINEGEGTFRLEEDRLASGQIDPSEDCFHYQRKEHEVFQRGAKQIFENDLEDMVRITDGDDYLDTMTVSAAAAEEPEQLLHLMAKLTLDQAFEVPCRYTHDPYKKMWTLESPAWFCASSFNSLAKWICCVLEKAIWSKYWEKTSADQKRMDEASADCTNTLKYLDDAAAVAEYWNSLSRIRKDELIGTPQYLIEQLQALDIPKKSFSVKPVVKTFNFSPGLFEESSCSKVAPLRLPELKRKVSYYNSESSGPEITDAAKSSGEALLEFLHLSPLDRAGTNLDKLCRKTAAKIHEAWIQKMAEDLMISEWSAKPTSRGKGKKRRRKIVKRIHSDDSSSTSASGRISAAAAEDEKDYNYGRRLVAELLKDIIEGLKDEAPIPPSSKAEDSDFLTVTHGKRKAKQAEPVQRKKTRGRAKQKIQRSMLKKSESPVAKESTTAFVQWETAEAPAKSLNESDFPPLAAAIQAKPTYAKLTVELERLQKRIEGEVEDLKPTRFSLMDKLNEVVGALFPGSFIQLYGSYASGLALPSSDIDIIVVNTGVYNSELLVSSLKYLGSALASEKWTSQVTVLDKAAVPVVKLTVHGSFFGSEHPIEADISIYEGSSVTNPGNSGMETTLMTRQILYQMPQVTTLCLFLKQLLQRNKLNSSFKGGVNSYTITLWVASYLVSQKQPLSSGELLIRLLEFYGSKFDFSTQAISYSEGGFVSRSPGLFGLVETRDPLNLANNTTRSSFMLETVQELFRKVHSRLEQLSCEAVTVTRRWDLSRI